MERKNIAILFGGCSEEHDISLKSAQEITKHMDTDRYRVFHIGITRDGRWLLCEKPSPAWETGACRSVLLPPNRDIHGLLFCDSGNVQPLDAVFPVLHGKMGEDGAVQGLLELSGIPYVGCGIASSALCMDKSLAYMAARAAGIRVPVFYIVLGDAVPDIPVDAYPVFVKPARSGSSFGVSRVDRPEALAAAIAEAGLYDDKILIERMVPGMEVGCAVLGNGTDLAVGAVDQITLQHGFFRIHQEEHPEAGSENAVILVPAAIPLETQISVQNTAKAVYRALGCRGLARVDMFLLEDGGIVLNEVNTMPGFTSYSRYPQMMLAAGLPLSTVIDRLLLLAIGA